MSEAPASTEHTIEAPSASQQGRVQQDATALPPPRPGVRHVRMPRIGIIVADDELRQRIDAYFHWPMIILALLMLPLLAIDLWLRPAPLTATWIACNAALGIIWLAFLTEFIVKISIAECRVEYVRRNWLDVIIIVLPALRPLRVAFIARTSRIFALRGVGMKFISYAFSFVIGLEATDRLLERLGLKSKDGRPDPRTMTRHQLMKELRKLRRLSDQWELWYEAEQDYLEKSLRTPPFESSPPREEADAPDSDDDR